MDLRKVIENKLMKERYQRLECLELERFNYSFSSINPRAIFPKDVDLNLGLYLVFFTTWQDYFILQSQGNNLNIFDTFRLEWEVFHQND